MTYRSLKLFPGGLAVLLATALAAPAPAYLYWASPQRQGGPAIGDEPELVVPLPGATPKEKQANLLLAMRAGLNVAALQCQFAPGLMTVGNYNNLLHQHDHEIDVAMDVLQGYFRKAGGGAVAAKPAAKGKKGAKAAPAGSKAAMTAYDQYVTKTYNSFSTLHAQLSFCDEAASIGREALALPEGQLTDLAVNRIREFRASLVPIGDARLGTTPAAFDSSAFPQMCLDRRGRATKCKA